MSPRRLLLLCLPLLAAVLLADGARAAPLTASPLLWATVNVCDPPSQPDTVGVRGSMPGSGRASEQMFLRFELQYRRAADGRWVDVGDSGFVDVGSGRYRARQTGRDFVVAPPASGSFTLRGLVTFEWRRQGKVVRRARRATADRVDPVAGAATCVLAAA